MIGKSLSVAEKAFLVLCGLFLISPSHPSFAFVNSALTAKVHPNSPQECTVSVIEIGPEIDGGWQPQLALLYDTQLG